MARVFYLPHPLQLGFMQHRCRLCSLFAIIIIRFFFIWLWLNGILNFNDHKCKLILNALLWQNLCLAPVSWLLFLAQLSVLGSWNSVLVSQCFMADNLRRWVSITCTGACLPIHFKRISQRIICHLWRLKFCLHSLQCTSYITRMSYGLFFVCRLADINIHASAVMPINRIIYLTII